MHEGARLRLYLATAQHLLLDDTRAGLLAVQAALGDGELLRERHRVTDVNSQWWPRVVVVAACGGATEFVFFGLSGKRGPRAVRTKSRRSCETASVEAVGLLPGRACQAAPEGLTARGFGDGLRIEQARGGRRRLPAASSQRVRVYMLSASNGVG